MAGLLLSSTAFNNGDPIPTRFTCQGEDISPPLFWEDTPPGTRSLAVLMEDLDAPTGDWCHWLAWDISAHEGALLAGATGDHVEGTTDFRRSGYTGPCPPEAAEHRYRFRLYALDRMLTELRAGASRQDFERAIQGHVLDTAALEGIYRRAPHPVAGR